MNHRVIATIMVVVMVFGAIAPAAPIQSSGPPEPEVLLPKGYDPATPISSFPHAVGIPAHKFFISDSPAPLREPVRLLPHTGSLHKVLHVRAETASIESELALAQRCEPLDLSLRIATDALPRRYAALQPTLSTYTVTTTADSGPGSLRQCLLDATAGTTCSFDPVAFPPGAPATIALLSPLPSIVTDSLTIDGSNAGVVLNGSGLSAGDGLLIIGADGVIIRGLQIRNFPRHAIGLAGGSSNVIIGGDRAIGAAPLGQGNLLSGNGAVGVLLQGTGTTGNYVLGNYIGTDATGAAPLGNAAGVVIWLGATGNVVGGNTSGVRNVISANTGNGVQIQDSGTSDNQVLGNYIGTDANGITALGNGLNGIGIGFEATDNIIGGDVAGARNVISGNTYNGIRIQNNGTAGNQVLGNYIGVNAGGTGALANGFGIAIMSGATANVIGGDTTGARNIISGNTYTGIAIYEDGTDGNQVLGNYIGTDANSATALGNGSDGIVIRAGAKNNVIGGDTAGARNVISGNAQDGIEISDDGTSANHVLGNYIGLDASGTAPLSNMYGVAILYGATDNVIGGDTAGARNVIGGNTECGVIIEGDGTSGNQVQGNYIGTDASGMVALGNATGVVITIGAKDNIVGGDTSGARNVISGNTEYGVLVGSDGTDGNQVQGNYIGTDASGTAALGNASGVVINLGAKNNVVGGTTVEARNVIGGHPAFGVSIEGNGTSGNMVQGNYIGLNASGAVTLSNAYGVAILYGATSNVVGGETAGARNVISGNTYNGIRIQDNGTNANQVLGNYIGTDASGTIALGNKAGIVINFGAKDNVVGGDTSGARNIISGNTGTGIILQDVGTTGNHILGNYIGTNISGAAALGNDYGISIAGSASNNVIGGDTTGARNVISGNVLGIEISDSGTNGNQVRGNYIGIDASGLVALGNVLGILISKGAMDNVVGGNTAGARNIISGNAEFGGIQIERDATTGNRVVGNYIGTDATGMAPLGNYDGVIIVHAQNNIIGGDTPGERNIISGNVYCGIVVQGNATVVLGNYIGTDATGTGTLGNGDAGVTVKFGAKNNVIGGDTAGARNVISGNNGVGVWILDEGTDNNQVLGNYIGTNASGEVSLGNTFGVVINLGAKYNVIGGDTAGARNVISGNANSGIGMISNGTTGNNVLGNYIGTDATGLTPLGNAAGVLVGTEATDNVIGGDTPGARNIISGNAGAGIDIFGEGATGNQVRGNYIGVDVTGLVALSNESGVVINLGAANNIVGGDTAGARNVISGNTGSGVQIEQNGTTGNQVRGNYIGIDAAGIGLLGNKMAGVAIIAGASNNHVGGQTPGSGNHIGGNTYAGVWLADSYTTNNDVAGNDILTNTTYGVYLGDGAYNNTVGVSNTIAYNGSAGVIVDGVPTRGNTVTRSSIHSNGDLPIKFINTPIPISAPVLTTTLCSGTALLPVTGSACPNCVIELYGNPAEGPGGTVFLAETTAGASGDFSTTVTCVLAYPYLSATATGSDGTTSEFYPGSTVPSWTMVFLPLVIRQTATSEPQGIYGRVTYNNVGVAGVHLDLRFYNGTSWSTRASAVTAANGNYQFSSVPGLNTGQAYYVRYLNGQSGNADNPAYLYSWFAPTITSYTSGAGVSGGSFDIADIPLVSPAHGASVTLPTNFLWTRRSITNDSYKFVLYYPAQSQGAMTGLLGYVQGVTVNGLPSGWPSGGVYYWWVEVHHGDGTENYGEAYGANRVTIYASTQAASSLTLSPGKGVEMYERGLQVSLEQSP